MSQVFYECSLVGIFVYICSHNYIMFSMLDFVIVQCSVNRPQVTHSTTFRIPGKPTTASGSTAITCPSSPSSSSSSMLRMQLSSPLLQTSSNPLTSPATKFSQAPNILTHLKQQQPMDQSNKSGSNMNTNNNIRFSGLLGKHGLD